MTLQLAGGHESRKYQRRTLLALTGAACGRHVLRKSVAASQLSGAIRLGFDGADPLISSFVESAVEELGTQHAGAEVHLEPYAVGNAAVQIVLQLSTGQGPDVFLLSAALIGELASSGYVEPLDSWLEQWDGWPQYRDAYRGAITWNDSVWALPYAIDTHFLYYRRDLFDKAGLATEWQPAEPEEILAVARSIRDLGNEDLIPYVLYAGANGGNSTVVRGFAPLVKSYGGALKNTAGQWIVDSCPIRAALDHYAQAYRRDQTVPEFVLTGATPVLAAREAFGAGEVGISYEGCWVFKDWLSKDEEDTLQNVGFVPFPGGGGNAPFSVGGIGNSWFMNAQSEHKDLAWAFIAAFNSMEAQVALNLADPHIPARSDSAADPVFQADPFLTAMVATADDLLLTVPDPAFRELIPIVQHATGMVASGEAVADEAIERYVSELQRVLGDDETVREECVA